MGRRKGPQVKLTTGLDGLSDLILVRLGRDRAEESRDPAFPGFEIDGTAQQLASLQDESPPPSPRNAQDLEARGRQGVP